MNFLVMSAGMVVLIGLSVLIGTSIDTVAQRSAWKRVAEERRLCAAEFRQLAALRQQVQTERQRLIAERQRSIERDADGRCGHCPFSRSRSGPRPE